MAERPRSGKRRGGTAPGRAGVLRSMTGYGRGRARNRMAAAEVELRSVNGRGMSVKLRLPPDGLALEPMLEEMVRCQVERGSVQGAVRVEALEGRPAQLRSGTLRRYLRAWRAAEKDLGLRARGPGLGDLLLLPGAVEPAAAGLRAQRAVSRAVAAAAAEALARLRASREREGRRLARLLRALLCQLRRDHERLRRRLPAAGAAAGERLRQRVRAAWAAAGIQEPLDLARELSVLAEKADVTEEAARLRIHLDRLEELLRRGGSVGRELEFLTQECQREITTLGSKLPEANLSVLLLRMKVIVQRLKEQAANVE